MLFTALVLVLLLGPSQLAFASNDRDRSPGSLSPLDNDLSDNHNVVRPREENAHKVDHNFKLEDRSPLTPNTDSDDDANFSLLGEVERESQNPLKDALNQFKYDISGFLNSATEITVNKWPIEKQNGYVTGLQGKYRIPQANTTITIGGQTAQGSEYQVFYRGEELNWAVRWDFDPDPAKNKFNHVNTHFFVGSRRVKFSWKLLPGASQYFNKGSPEKREKRTNNNIYQYLNKITGYEYITSVREPVQLWTPSYRIAFDGLKDYFRRVVTGEIPY